MDITSFLLGLQKGKMLGGGTITEGVDPYYQQLAETMMSRNPEYLGDKKVLILKSFTLSDGNTLGSLLGYSFAGFTYVEGMVFSYVVMVNANAFCDCKSLKVLDIEPSGQMPGVYFMDGALNGCTALESIIVRGGTEGLAAVTVTTSNGANDTFCVYVPSEYYDTVIANLANYTNNIDTSRYRKLEDYPEIDNWNTNA